MGVREGEGEGEGEGGRQGGRELFQARHWLAVGVKGIKLKRGCRVKFLRESIAKLKSGEVQSSCV